MIKKIHSKSTRFEQLLLLLILLLGAVLRLAALGSVPGGMHQDEAFVSWNAFAVFREGMDSAGHRFPVYMADWGDGHSALYVWLLMPLLLFSGGHAASPFLSRLPQAVVSIFTLWAVYCIMTRLFNRRAGLWSAFLLAVCPWHIMMSRWGLDANLAPGFLIFGLLFFIMGLERKKFLLLSGMFYGLSLYSYAAIWPIVPFILILQILYGLYHKKLRFDRWSLCSALILFVMALPLLLFILVNSEILPEITLPFMTIPKMGGYRGKEVAFGLSEMWSNLRSALYLLRRQDNGSPYDILLPWGLYYDLGRVFIVIGIAALLKRLVVSLRRKTFSGEYFLFVQLCGGALNCLLVTAKLHQIDSLYIPLALGQAYGVWTVIEFLRKKLPSARKVWSSAAALGVTTAYLVCLLLFQKDYYTDYRQLVGAYFAEGLKECVDFAWEQCEENHIANITAEKGAQWPRLLLYTETLPSEYLSSVVYDVAPAPASFETRGIRINTRIDYEDINQESVYIIYFTDVPVFEENFTLTGFHDWYVAVPGKNTSKQPPAD